jgi:hypothetical protein
VLAEHPDLTLTKLYNVLERLRAGAAVGDPTHSHGERVAPEGPGEGVRRSSSVPEPEDSRRSSVSTAASPHPGASHRPSPSGRGLIAPLTDVERDICERGLVLILKELHERIDALVAEAYGWPADLAEEEILARLVALNKARAAEERRGLVRWLRPDYQVPKFGTAKEKAELELAGAAAGQTEKAAGKPRFPAGDVERTAAVFAMLAAAPEPIDAAGLAARFSQGQRVEPQVRATLQALARMGHLAAQEGGRRFALRRVG